MVGSRSANSSIGSQWAKQGRIDELDAHVKEKYKILSEEQKGDVKMNVNLKY